MKLVLDMGGTFLRIARCDPSGSGIGSVRRFETPNFFGNPNVGDAASRLADFVVDSVEQAAEGDAVDLVCFGFPGPVDRDGNVLAAPTIWGRQSDIVLPFSRMVEERSNGWKVYILNDLTAAGYHYISDTRRDFLIVTVGSGVGSKLFLGAAPEIGTNARGGEIGHLRVDFSDTAPVCDCGGRGHIGAISSGRAVERTARQRAASRSTEFRMSALFDMCKGIPSAIDNNMIAEAFRRQDPWTTGVVRNCTRPLAQALASIHLHIGLEQFVIIGGFAEALGETYRQMICELASSIMWNNGFEWLRGVHLSETDDNPGLNGAHKFLVAKTARVPSQSADAAR